MIELSKPLPIGLAPMEGVTDFATRIWFAMVSSPTISSSPFLRITRTFPRPADSAADFWPELGYAKNLIPYEFVPQVMASDIDDFLRASEVLLRDVPFIELNCGCPSPTVVGHLAGSSLLKSPDVFFKWLERATTALGPDRVRIKMRTGFYDHQEFPELLKILLSVKLRALTIHARTREQRYSGEAQWQWIDLAAKTLPYPVIGSGDIASSESLASKIQSAPNIAGVIIGRGALQNPWVFCEIRDKSFNSVDNETVLAAIEIFGWLQHLAYEEGLQNEFREVVTTHCLAKDYIKDPSATKSTAAYLRSRFGSCDSWSKRTLGRVKLLWSHMRLRFGDPDPKWLRVQKFSDFKAL